ncbi:MAG: hypothetical protein MK193_10115 [Lentisphaeria bacterium]|nr:hypothetical protein [Lentisphaeria bacterium]
MYRVYKNDGQIHVLHYAWYISVNIIYPFGGACEIDPHKLLEPGYGIPCLINESLFDNDGVGPIAELEREAFYDFMTKAQGMAQDFLMHILSYVKSLIMGFTITPAIFITTKIQYLKVRNTLQLIFVKFTLLN